MRKTQLGCTILEGHDVADLPLVSENAEILEKELLKKATQEQDGRMSKEDKTKLDGIEAGANKYVHPKTHSADIIIPNADRRFVSDTEKEAWNAKETPEGAQAKVDAVQTNLDEHKADYVSHAGYGTASGTNAKTITLNPAPSGYKEGMTVAFKNVTQNTGAVTLNVNGKGAKPVLKSNGSALSSGNLKAGSIYTVRYNGSNFILQGEGGEYGTAQAQDVLEGKTIGTEEGLVAGAMPNIGKQTGRITTKGGRKYISKGYHDGTGYIDYDDPNHIPSNIRKGVNIANVVGVLEEYKHPISSSAPSEEYLTFDTGNSLDYSAIVYGEQRTIRIKMYYSVSRFEDFEIRLTRNGTIVDEIFHRDKSGKFVKELRGTFASGDTLRIYIKSNGSMGANAFFIVTALY